MRTTMVALGLCTLRKLFTILHACDLDHQALGCAYGDKTRWVLEHTMLWNGQHLQSNKEIPDESKSSSRWCTHRWRTRQTKNACPPDVPPEAIPTAPAASKTKANISSWNLVLFENNGISLSCLGIHGTNQVRP